MMIRRITSSAPLRAALSRSASTLLVADHTNDAVTPATLSTMVAAAALGGDVTVLVVGQGCSGAADGAAAMDGVSAVLLADDAALAHDVAENVAGCVLAAHPINVSNAHWSPPLANAAPPCPWLPYRLAVPSHRLHGVNYS